MISSLIYHQRRRKKLGKSWRKMISDGPMLIGHIHVWKVDEDTNQ